MEKLNASGQEIQKTLQRWKFERKPEVFQLLNEQIAVALEKGETLILKTTNDFTPGVTSVRNTERFGSREGDVWTFRIPGEGDTRPTKYNGKLYLEADVYVGNQMLALREAFPSAGSTGVALFFPEEVVSIETE